MIAAIIQARIGSSRLPAKVLLPLPNGCNVLREVVRRAKQIHGINEVVVAVPTKDLKFFTPFVEDLDAGPELDVLHRYAIAARSINASVIMRLTADCPLLNPVACEAILHVHLFKGGFATNNHDCEVFSRRMLEEADDNAEPHQREHVTTYMREHFPIHTITSAKPRTLDTIDDYRAIWEAMSADRRQGNQLKAPLHSGGNIG